MNLQYKKQGYILSIEVVVVLAMLFVVVFAGSKLGANFITAAHCDVYRKEANYIDKALNLYAYSHAGADTDTVYYNENSQKIVYNKTKRYPQTLAELGAVRTDFGYFNRAILLITEGESVTGAYGGDFGKFRYTVNTAADGTMTYHLEVTLPDGTNYVSPQSDR